MKLKVRTNKGWFGRNNPNHEAVAHHESKEAIEDYTESAINRRVDWDFDVKKYSNSADMDGITIINWEESVTKTAQVIAIASAVALAVITALALYSPLIVATFGAAAPAIIAAATVAATTVAIGTCMGRTREYIGCFTTANGKLVSEDEADKIKKLNQTTIKSKLVEIADLLNDNKVDSFDIDKAKEALVNLDKEHKEHISNNNKTEYTKLTKQSVEKHTEYVRLLLNQTNKIIEEIRKNFDKTDANFVKASANRDAFHQKTQEKFVLTSEEVEASRESADEEFIRAKLHREELNTKTATELNITREEISKLQEKLDIEFRKATEQRNRVYEDTAAKMNHLHQEIVKSREKMMKELKEAKEDRAMQFKQYIDQFEIIFDQHMDLQNAMSEEFKVSSDAREEIFKNVADDIEKIRIEVKENRTQLENEFKKAKEKRAEIADAQRVAFGKLSVNQKQGFNEATKDRDVIKSKIESNIVNIRDEVEKSFNSALQARENTYCKTQEFLSIVEKKVIESRKIIEGRFLEAIRQRKEIYEQSEKRLTDVQREIEKSRQQADKKFEEAYAAREALYNKTAEELKANSTEILKSRAEIDQKFEQAVEHRNTLYEKTAIQLKTVNENVTNLRKECDANFKKAEEHRNELYEKTAKHLTVVNENITGLRDECDANFKKAEKHRNEIFKDTSEKIGKIDNSLMLDSEYVKILQPLLKISLEQKESIDAGKHSILMAIKSTKFTQSIGSPATKELLDRIKKEFEAFQSSSDEPDKAKKMQEEVSKIACDQTITEVERQSKIKLLCENKEFISTKAWHLNEAIKIAVSAARKEGEQYNFKIDKLQVVKLLNQQLKFTLDESSKTIINKISEHQSELIEVYSDINQLKLDLSEKIATTFNNRSEVNALESLIGRMLEENLEIEKEHNILTLKRDNIKEELEYAFEIMGSDKVDTLDNNSQEINLFGCYEYA